MDPLLPALVAVLFANAIDRPPLLAAVLAERHAAGSVAAGSVLAQATGFAVAATLGALAAPMLNPNARSLLVALALLSAGLSSFRGPRIADRLERWRTGGAGTAFLGTLIIALGDRSQFLVFALSARTPAATLATIGATLAAAAATIAAVSLGTGDWARLGGRAVRWPIGGVLTTAGAVTLVSALRLV